MFRKCVVLGGVLLALTGVVYGAQHKVGQKNRLFSPAALTLKSGDVLVFQNDDDVTHHVYSSTKGQEFDLKTVAPGEKTTRTFAKAGRVDVRCGLHAGMRLVVTVE